MHLFRSEEHVLHWSGYRHEARDGLLSLAQVRTIFATRRFSERLSGTYVSRLATYRGEFLATLAAVTAGSPFWAPEPPS
jgi:hypothetical protein